MGGSFVGRGELFFLRGGVLVSGFMGGPPKSLVECGEGELTCVCWGGV